MEKSTEILNELIAISPALAEIERVNVFDVPEGYFNGLEEKIATTVFLQQDKKTGLQKIPEGYFDSLSSNILSKIKEEEKSASAELKSLPPALHYLKEENVFDVPDEYFADLSSKILNRIKDEGTKVIPLNSVKKWWRYAAAAVVAGIITIFSFQFFNTQNANKNSVVASSSDKTEYMQLASEYKTEKQIDQGIASLSDDEIANYLEKNTTILDDETLTKNTDTKELPTPDDYLIDDNALNNYLQKINIENTNENFK